MMFWISAAALTLAAAIMVLWPLLKQRHGGPGEVADGLDHDIAVYRDQLIELDDEETRGVIGSSDAEQARAEIGRRLLAAEARRNAAEGASRRGANWSRTFLASVAVIFVPVLSLILYSGLGSPDLPSEPLGPRLAALREQEQAGQKAREDMQALVSRAEEQLKANPDDGRGWDVLAPIYLRIGRFDDAIMAFENAIRLIGPDARRYSGLGEAHYAKAQGVVVPEAADAFRSVLNVEPGEPRARFFLALADAQQGKREEAETGWQSLANDEAVEAQWRSAAEEGLRLLATGDPAQIPGSPQELQARAPQPSMPQLDQETIAGAQSMNAEDRSAMIQSMVARLDARLRENPDDAEGWMRLMRAHIVLDQREEAADALKRALETFSDDAKKAGDIRAFAQSLNMTVPGEGG